MTTAAQLARDALPYGTVLVDGRRYTMREDWWDVADRAALKFARKGPETAQERASAKKRCRVAKRDSERS